MQRSHICAVLICSIMYSVNYSAIENSFMNKLLWSTSAINLTSPLHCYILLLCNTGFYSIVLNNTYIKVLYNTLAEHTMQSCTIRRYTVLICTLQFLWSTVMNSTLLYSSFLWWKGLVRIFILGSPQCVVDHKTYILGAWNKEQETFIFYLENKIVENCPKIDVVQKHAIRL